VRDKAGWRPTFLMLSIVTAMSAIPASVFAVKEYREWKASRRNAQNSSEIT
jgi:hypothetical protein